MTPRILPSSSPLLLLSLLLACADDAPADTVAGTGGTSDDSTDTTDSTDTADSTGAEDETGDETTDGEPDSECIPTGLGEMTTFSLPAGLGPLDGLWGGNCEEGRPSWLVRDMTGDGIVDLVITSDCTTDAPGDSWTLYQGTPSGFSSEPLPWALPSPHGDPQRYLGWGCNSCSHQVRDVDGDGLQDMLVAYVLGELDAGHWWLHRGTGSGFEYGGTRYDLPAGNMLFWNIGSTSCFEPPSTQSSQWFPEYFLQDFDGDARLDMVVDSDCDSVSLSGEERLDVYLGGPTAFASPPAQWSMPSASPLLCETTPLPIRRFDIDGDGQPEVVDPKSCAYVYEPAQWLVYDAAADGYTTAPRTYSVPAHVAGNGLVTDMDWLTLWMDFTLDGVPDVLTIDTEQARWVLDRGAETGLEPIIELPAPTIADEPLLGVRSSAENPVQHDIVTLDRSQPPALVVTGRPDDPEVGSLHWEVYPFECVRP